MTEVIFCYWDKKEFQMSANIEQIYTNNPLTTLNNDDLLYVGVNGTVDGAIQYQSLATQLGAGLWAAGGGTGAIKSSTASSASGNYALSFGNFTFAIGDYSFSFGSSCFAISLGSFALGASCQAGASGNSAQYSFSFGNGTNTALSAQSNYSFAFGNACSTGLSSNSDYSFAFGNGSSTSGNYSFAFGNSAATQNNGSVVWGDSSGSTPHSDSTSNQFNLTFTNGYRFFGGSFNVSTVGRGIAVAEGSNAKQGTATLSSGTVVVSNTSVTANSRIFLTAQDNNSTGALRVSARTAATSFTITSSSGSDSGVVAYEIFEPAV